MGGVVFARVQKSFLRIGCLEFGMVLGIGCMNPRLHSAYDVK